MEKKSVAIILGIILIFICLFIGGQYLFSYPDAQLTIQESGYTDQNPPPSDTNIKILTDEDFDKYPALKDILQNGSRPAVSDNPFFVIKSGGNCLSRGEAGAILATYSSKYIHWNGNYYHLMQIVT